ncbi:MAG TPA: hypothetical protein VKX17_25485 [Planctomycetota bacterium]|nr:hypothetical protein [Planctomycetota bacterium]
MARASRTPKIRLGELLIAAGLVTEDKVRHGLEEQRRNNLFLGEALVNLGYVTEEGIAQAIIQHFNLPFLSATQFNIPPEVFNLFPERMYNEYQFIAVDKIDRVIIIVAAGPMNQDMMEELERVSECKICHYVSTWTDIHAAIQRNSKELGGQAQVELTGLGSMLLDAPKANLTGTAKLKKLDASMPGIGASTVSQVPGRSIIAPSLKAAMSSANLSAMLSPLAAASKIPGLAPVTATPPSPRLTAFLKVPAPSAASMPAFSSNGNSRQSGSPALPSAAALSSANLLSVMGQSSQGIPAMSNPNLRAVVGASSAGIPTPKGDGAEDPNAKKVPPTRMSSFLNVRKEKT